MTRTRMEFKGNDIEVLRKAMFYEKQSAKSKMVEQILEDITNGKYDDLSVEEDILSVSISKEKVTSAKEHLREVSDIPLNKFVKGVLNNIMVAGEDEQTKQQQAEVVEKPKEEPKEEPKKETNHDNTDDTNFF